MTASNTTKTALASMSLNDLLGTPTPYVAPAKPAKVARVLLTDEEKKAKRNEAQRALRSSPEGKAYANEASKRSIAKKKAAIAAELEALRAIVATVVAVEVAEVAEVVEVSQEEVAIKKPRKGAKKDVGPALM